MTLSYASLAAIVPSAPPAVNPMPNMPALLGDIPCLTNFFAIILAGIKRPPEVATAEPNNCVIVPRLKLPKPLGFQSFGSS